MNGEDYTELKKAAEDKAARMQLLLCHMRSVQSATDNIEAVLVLDTKMCRYAYPVLACIKLIVTAACKRCQYATPSHNVRKSTACVLHRDVNGRSAWLESPLESLSDVVSMIF